MSNYLVKEFFERELFKYYEYRIESFYAGHKNNALSILADIHKKNIFTPSIIFSINSVKGNLRYLSYIELCDNPKYKEILK